jgi:hypothetical protein
MRVSPGLIGLLTPAVLLGAAPRALTGQMVVMVQGGVRLERVGPPTQSLQQTTGARSSGARGVTGEATTAGTRIAIGISRDWILDGGLVWSHSSNRSTSVARTAAPIGPRTLFISSTIQTRLTNPARRVVLVGGVGPALLFDRGDGTAASRHTNVGGLAALGAVLRLDTRTALRLDAQQYLFSGDIADGYTPHLGTGPLRSAGTGARTDFVLLAGISWRAK